MTDRELMQRALVTLEMEAKGHSGPHKRLMPVIWALTERLKEPDLKPVAWVVYDTENNDVVWTEEGKKLKAETPLYVSAAYSLTDDQLIEEVRRRGFPIRSATTIHPKPQAYLDTGLGAFYWSREFPEGPPPGFAPVYIDYTAK